MDNGSLGAHGDLHALVTHHGMKHVGGGLYEHHGLVGDLSKFSDDSESWTKAKWHTALHVLHLDAKGSAIHAALVQKHVANGMDELAARQVASQQVVTLHPDTVKGSHHLGPGLTTNAAANLNAWNAKTGTLNAIMNSFNSHAIGTGATAAAASDFYLQTPQGATNLSGTTNGYMTGTQGLTLPNVYTSAATFTATGAIAVTEWAIAMANAANFSRTATGTPTSTTFPDSGASFTTAGNGLTGWTIEIASSALNTPTTTAMALVTSNTATQLNMTGGWWTLANASASTPGVNVAYVVYPTILDHKVFSVVNMASTDTLQTTYSLTFSSGT